MQITIARLFSVVVAAVEIVVIALLPGHRSVAESGIVLVAALVLIWFSEQLGSATGFIGHGEVTSETPGWMVAGFGWCVMVGLPVFLWWEWRG